MSVSYSIDIKTRALFNKETIKKIYDTASALDYSFFKVEEAGLNMAAYLSFEELYHHITRSPDVEEDFPGMLWLQIQNTTLFFQIKKSDNNLLDLYISPDLWVWKNWFRNTDNCIDYQRYFRSLLILCAEFPIDSIKTYTFY